MTTPRRTPDWLLERIALGELPAAELAAARARLAEEPEGEARLAALEAENRDVLEKLPPSAVAREVELRAAQARRMEVARGSVSPLRRIAPAFVLVPALAVALLMVVRPEGTPTGGSGELSGLEPTRTKGLAPQLVLHRQGAAGPERLVDGAAAATGDVVQVSYVAAGQRYGAILSVDGRGAVTLHAPDAATGAVPLAPSGTHALPSAYALDDAPAFERFFLITSDTPFALEEVLAAARTVAASASARTAPLALPERYTQVSFTLEKVSP
ncbi:ActD-like protein [Hyalangium rubrum]|uniref:ActD-like protein n=1 Tax=Hyalangium rubrum TaxID=3103134 RepID=A0ABU5HBL0_9BACT|nr:ActD-like protein [Hyalangium sp. s54d21]MDY7230218.1 ActD-like protein [Hyalangium sp. s54d21]